MSAVFFKVLGMSFAGSFMIIVSILLRLVIKRSPKWVICLFWAIVAVKLICPWQISIPLGRPLDSHFYVQELMESLSVAGISQRFENAAQAVNEGAVDSGNMSQNISVGSLSIVPAVWVFGAAIMLFKGSYDYLKLCRKVAAAVPLGGDLYALEGISSPFIFGFVRSKIVIPLHIDAQTLKNTVLHEKAHINRGDQWWKLVWYAVRAVHWFNPLVWVAFVLFSKDVELACDEKVIKDMNRDEIANYAQSLLGFSGKWKPSAGSVAFVETDVKTRIKRVLNYRKPKTLIVMVSLVLCLVIGLCFMTSPVFAGGLNTEADIAASGLTDDVLLAAKNRGWVWPCDSRRVTFPFGKFVMPVLGSTGFSDHVCIDARKGDSVYAAHSGTILFAGFDEAYGYFVIIQHSPDLLYPDDIKTVYRHLSAINVYEGAPVSAGQIIGFVGDTGSNASGPHLAFCLIKITRQWIRCHIMLTSRWDK